MDVNSQWTLGQVGPMITQDPTQKLHENRGCTGSNIELIQKSKNFCWILYYHETYSSMFLNFSDGFGITARPYAQWIRVQMALAAIQDLT